MHPQSSRSLVESVRTYEDAARRLELSQEELGALWAAVGDNIIASASQRNDALAYVADKSAAVNPFSPEEEPARLADALAALDAVAGLGINQTSGGHFAFIPGGGLVPAAFADLLADLSNVYAGVHFAAPAATALERSLVRWLADLVGYPETAGGDLTSGGSVAHLEGLVTAREATGLRPAEAEQAVIYLTRETHHCIEKSLRICGLGDAVVRRIELDERRRMRPDALAETVAADKRAGLRPWLVVATAGTTDAGAVDPLQGIADVADEYGLWLHVDAAYGGFFLLTEHGRRMLAGIGRSQTSVVDPHKGLFLPFGSGALVVRDERQLARAHRYSASYLADAREAGGVFSASDLSVELSRPFRGPRLWLPLKLFGLEPFRAALEEKLLLARYLHSRLSEMPGWEVGPEPDLSVVTYRYIPRRGSADEFNRRLLDAILQDGRAVVSATRLDGTYTLRAAVLNYRSHLEHVDVLLAVLEEQSLRLEAS